MSDQLPSVGRIVHAAVGAKVEGSGRPVTDETCDLVVLNPQGLFFNTCDHNETTRRGGTWHWPERVEGPGSREMGG